MHRRGNDVQQGTLIKGDTIPFSPFDNSLEDLKMIIFKAFAIVYIVWFILKVELATMHVLKKGRA